MIKQLGYQVEVFNKEEAIEYFKTSNYEDCRINAYPSFTEYHGINRTLTCQSYFWSKYWNALSDNIPGRLNPQNQDEFWSNEYGPIYRNTISQKIVDALGAVRKRKNNGVMLIFDEEKIKELKKMSAYEVQDQEKIKDTAPDAYNEPARAEHTNALKDESVSSVSSEGYRVCGYIIEEIEE